MIQKNSTWHDKKETKIGDYGEKLVKAYLEANGCICYRPETDGAHLMDFLVYKRDKSVMAAECKVKAIRCKYPDTGFNLRNYKLYKKFTDEHNIRMFIFFIDEVKGKIYGNFLDVLDQKRICNGREYPLNEKTKYNVVIRYYPYEAMIKLKKLSNEELDYFQKLRSEDI